MKKILYISYDGLSDTLGQSQILPYLIKLSERGYQFTILSAEKPQYFEQEKAQIQKLCTQNNISWHYILYRKKPPIISTLRDIAELKKEAYRLQQQENFDIVHTRSYIPSLIALSLKKKFKLKWLFDMRGFWADERIDGNIWDLSKLHYRWIYSYFKKKEKTFFQKADAIVSLTYKAQKWMQEQWKVNTPINVIPCATDTRFFKLKSSKQNEQQAVTLGYLGSIGTWYMLDEMLDFFKVLQSKYPKAKFKFITRENKNTILDKAKEKGINSSAFIIKAAKREDVPKELSSIDLGIFFIKDKFSKKASSPVKQGEFMSMGIPIITAKNIGDTDFIIKKYKSGIWVDDFTKTAYQKAIEEIPNLLSLAPSDIREGAEDYFSLEKGVDTYQKIYEDLLN